MNYKLWLLLSYELWLLQFSGKDKINTNQPSLRLFIPNFVKVRNKC